MSEVRLTEHQNANVNQCGSCKYFRRSNEGRLGMGNCKFKLPTWIKVLHTRAKISLIPVKDDDINYTKIEEFVINCSDEWTLVEDVEGCSFWQPSGLTYVKDQVWKVE